MPKKKIEISKNIKFYPTSKLVPYEKNARTHSPEQVSQIAASILEFGFTNPVLIDAKFGVIAGHGRLEAAKSLGLSEVPVIVLDHLTDLQKRAYILADNKLALNAGWDEEVLAEELAALLAADYNIDTIGFSEKDLRELLPEESEQESERADAIPEVAQNELGVELGDIYQLGEHRLMCGDSTDLATVEKLMSGEKAEICFTSPPYADQREYCGGLELSTQHLATFIKAAKESVNYFAVNLGMSRKDGEINTYWDDYISSAKISGLKLLSWNIWDKGDCGSIGNQSAMFGIRHEWIFIFGEKPKQLNLTNPNRSAGRFDAYNGHREKDGTVTRRDLKNAIREFRQLDTVYNCLPMKDRSLGINHPAMFPVEFAEGYINAMTNQGDGVYEPFCGSGSTLIACEKTNRKCFGMELDPHYCSVIIKRWENFTGKKAKKIFPIKTILKKKK